MTLRLSLILLTMLIVISLGTGVITIDLEAGLFAPQTWQLLWISRGPRTIAALITGAALAICGAILHMIVRNRFVEPMSAGTGQGAVLGILLVTLYLPDASILSRMAIASAVAFLASLGFLVLLRAVPRRDPLLVPLIAVVYGGILGAVATFFAYHLDLLQFIEIWLSGEFSGVLLGRYEILFLAAGIAFISYFIAHQFAILGLGRSAAISLGLNHDQTVFLGLLCISAVTALTVITVGMIPFVGLVIPNLVSLRYGENLRATLPIVALWGATGVLACDILGRVIRAPYEIPVSTVFGVVGAAIFLWLLLGSKRRHG